MFDCANYKTSVCRSDASITRTPEAFLRARKGNLIFPKGKAAEALKTFGKSLIEFI